jgi:hypothetical protein
VTLVLLVALVVWLAFSVRRKSPLRIAGPRATTLIVATALIAFFAFVFLLSLPLKLASGLAPMALSVFAIILCVLILTAALRTHDSPQSDETMRYVGLTALFVAATPIVGILPASLAYMTDVLRRAGVTLKHAFLIALGCCALQLLLLVSVFDVLIEREIIGRVLWAALGY